MDTKRCGKCREILPTSDFIPRRDKPDKFLPNCKACRGEAKKSKSLQRGSNLKRTPMKRTPMKRGNSQMKRTQLKPVSDHRREVNKQRKEALVARFGPREKWVCSVSHLIPTKCFGDVNGHEILSRARAGRTDKNLLDTDGIILVCNHHNSWIEDFPAEAHALGLTKHSWEV